MRWILVLGVLLVACGGRDPRLEGLAAGISKDSAMTLMGVERPQRVDPYLVDGRNFEIMYYDPPGADPSEVTDRKRSPLIVVDGALLGWGWNVLDSVSAATRIAVEKK